MRPIRLVIAISLLPLMFAVSAQALDLSSTLIPAQGAPQPLIVVFGAQPGVFSQTLPMAEPTVTPTPAAVLATQATRVATVPEPATLALVGLGLLGLLPFVRRTR